MEGHSAEEQSTTTQSRPGGQKPQPPSGSSMNSAADDIRRLLEFYSCCDSSTEGQATEEELHHPLVKRTKAGTTAPRSLHSTAETDQTVEEPETEPQNATTATSRTEHRSSLASGAPSHNWILPEIRIPTTKSVAPRRSLTFHSYPQSPTVQDPHPGQLPLLKSPFTTV